MSEPCPAPGLPGLWRRGAARPTVISWLDAIRCVCGFEAHVQHDAPHFVSLWTEHLKACTAR